jgi:hypothetical protein
VPRPPPLCQGSCRLIPPTRRTPVPSGEPREACPWQAEA